MKRLPKFPRIPFVSPKGALAPTKLSNAKLNSISMCLWLTCAFFLSALSLRAADPTLSFFANDDGAHLGDERIRVFNITPSGKVLFFGDSWIRKDAVNSLVTTRVIKKTNTRGRTNLRHIDLVEKAIWCAVDLSTGKYVIDSVTSSAGTEHVITQYEMFKTPSSFSFNGRRLNLLIVRPGQAAWSASVVDGGPIDRGASSGGRPPEEISQDEQVKVQFSDLALLWDQGSGIGIGGPQIFNGPEAGDLILGINPDEMTYFAFIYGGAK